MRSLIRSRVLGCTLGMLALSVLGLTIVECNTYYLRDLVIENIYGSKPHRVPCHKWPTPDEVRRVLDLHAEVIRTIEAINPGYVEVRINVWDCPGRADIRVLYATASDREAIKSILGEGKYFFGIPWQMRNI